MLVLHIEGGGEGERLIGNFSPLKCFLVPIFRSISRLSGISKVILSLILNIQLLLSKISTISYFNVVERLRSEV